jgi:Flp pilus assembly protein TadD
LYNARGLALLSSDRPAAIASFKRAIELSPKAYGYVLNLARANAANGDAPGAFGVIEGLLKSEPGYSQALILGAALSLQTGQTEKAAGYVERLHNVAPGATATMTLEGDVAMAQRRYGDALASYRRANAQTPNNQIVAAEFRAATMAGEPHPEKILEEWLAKHPADTAVLSTLAELKRSKGDIAGATAMYETALKASPEDPALLNNLAMIYDARKDPRALAMAEKAYKVAPKSPSIQDTYGWLLFRNGQASKSVELLRSAYRALPQNAEVQYHLAAALAKTGEKNQALDLIQIATKGQLPEYAKADAKALLDELSK